MIPSLWTSMFIRVPAARQCEELAAAGFRYAELSCEAVVDPESGRLSERHAERLRRAYDRLGVRMLQVHYPIGTLDPDALAGEHTDFAHASEARREFDLCCAEELIRLCPLMGIEVMVVHPGGAGSTGDEDEIARIHRLNVAGLGRLGALAERTGVRVAVENAGRGYCADPAQLAALVDAVGSPAVGVCLDTSHANMAKVDIPAAIRGLGSRLVATHISDNLGTHDDHLLPYAGRIEWPPVIAALKQIGYERLLNLEIPGENRCPLEILRLKARYARELLGEMVKVT